MTYDAPPPTSLVSGSVAVNIARVGEHRITRAATPFLRHSNIMSERQFERKVSTSTNSQSQNCGGESKHGRYGHVSLNRRRAHSRRDGRVRVKSREKRQKRQAQSKSFALTDPCLSKMRL